MKNTHIMILLVSLLAGSVSYAADYEASVSFSSEVQLGLPVSGLVETLKVRTGQQVSKGDELLSLDQAHSIRQKSVRKQSSQYRKHYWHSRNETWNNRRNYMTGPCLQASNWKMPS